MTERQERLAAALVANHAARLKPVEQTRCVHTIELKANTLGGNLYVTRSGDVRIGYTLRTSRSVDATFRNLNCGE